ncbi:hypothetical protein D3C72_937660 [compost metagenome]
MTSTPTFTVSEISKTISTATNFGIDMATDGNKVIVGTNSLKAFIYEHDGTQWIQEAELQHTVSGFGARVAIAGEWVAVSTSAGTGTNGTIIVYRNISGTWTEFQTITRPTAYTTNGFAADISLSGNTLVVGHMMEGTGGVHTYEFDGTSWGIQGNFLTVLSSETGRTSLLFGLSVSIDGDVIAVGGVVGGESTGSGMVFYSKRTGTTWSTPSLVAPTVPPVPNCAYGWSVKVSGNKILVGSTGGVNQNGPTFRSGRGYLFDVSGSSPIEELIMQISKDGSQIINDNIAGNNDRFGWCMDISESGNFIAISAPSYVSSRGSVYFYEKLDGVWGPSAMPNSRTMPTTSSQRFGASFVFVKNGLMVGSPMAKAITWFESSQLSTDPTFVVSEAQSITESGSFGSRMAHDDNTLVVCTYGANKFFIYENNGIAWVEVNEFSKPPATQGYFGTRAAISGEWIAVSNSNSSNSFNATVTMYRKVDGVWTEHSTIENPTNHPDEGFGISLALDNNTLVVGKVQSQSDQTLRGGVFVYVWNGTNWVVQGDFLTIPNEDTRQTYQYLGLAVDIEGDTIVVGGPGSTSGVFGGKGMVFIAKRVGTTWTVSETVQPTTTYNDAYGIDVQIQNGKLLVGASTGDTTEAIPGRVYLYDISGTTAVLEDSFTVKTDNSELIQDTLITTNALYGITAQLSNDGNVLAVGAPSRYTNRGIVYFYEKVNGQWGLSALSDSWLKLADTTTLTYFGTDLTFVNEGLVIGARGNHTIYWFK